MGSMARFVPLAALALPLVSGARLADLLKTAATGTAPPPPAVDSDDLPQCKLPSTLPKFTELKSPYAAALHPNGGLLELVCTGGREPAASKDGYPAEIVMECKDGYFQEKEHVACVFASPCGKPVANANHASYSGIEDKEKGYLYRCDPDFSLSGQDGGTFSNPSNREFHVQCMASGSFSDFASTCKPVETKVASAYQTLFEVLFKVDCQNGVLRPSTVNAKNGPDFAGKMCSGLEDTKNKTECDGMVTKLDGDLKANWGADSGGKVVEGGKAGVAEAFCGEVWGKFVEDGRLKGPA